LSSGSWKDVQLWGSSSVALDYFHKNSERIISVVIESLVELSVAILAVLLLDLASFFTFSWKSLNLAAS